MELKFKIVEIKQIESHFALNPDFKIDNDKPIEIDYRINISFDKKDKMVNVVVSIVSDNKNQPFTFNIATAGLFNFNKLPRKQELEKVARINCASIILPYIRESLADLTRRAGLTPFHIAPVNFIKIYEEQKKAKTKGNSKKTEKAGK